MARRPSFRRRSSVAGPPRRTGRKTGDAMLRADSRRVAMKLQQPSPPSSRGNHQTSSSKAIFVAASRLASMSSMGLFAPVGAFRGDQLTPRVRFNFDSYHADLRRDPTPIHTLSPRQF
jgi:hypothetical protein